MSKTTNRALGWDIGRQIIALYLLEMLLKTYLERRDVTHVINTHNLALLFRRLSKNRRDTVEQIYTQILNSEVEWTWDICRTVECFLDFLGKNPIGKSRYPWQQQHIGTLFAPGKLRPVVVALYIGLHEYPYETGALDKRFDTQFRSFSESRKNRYDS